MTNLFDFIWEYLINFLELSLFYYYVRTVLTPKTIKYVTLIHILMLLPRFLFVSVCNTLSVPFFYVIVAVTLYNAIFCCILFKEKTILCIFTGLLHAFLCICSEFLSMIFLQAYAKIVPSALLFGESYRFPVTTLYIIILGAFSFFVPTLFRKKTPLFTSAQKFFVSVMMLLGIVITHCFIYLMPQLEKNNSELLNVIILANVVFICFFSLLLIYVYQLALTQQKNSILQEKNQLLSMEEQQYNNLLSSTESLRELKHDIHHHLLTIASLLKEKDNSGLDEYLTEYQKHFELDYSIISSGNIVVDSVIATKEYFSKQNNIDFSYSIMLTNTLPITDVTLSALLGNLFDNATEACMHVNEPDTRWINFQMKTQKDMLIIHIENSYDGTLLTSTNSSLLSRKKEANHGIGLKRIYSLVEEADGFVDIRHELNIFTVHIMIPLEDTNEH